MGVFSRLYYNVSPFYGAAAFDALWVISSGGKIQINQKRLFVSIVFRIIMLETGNYHRQFNNPVDPLYNFYSRETVNYHAYMLDHVYICVYNICGNIYIYICTQHIDGDNFIAMTYIGTYYY